MAIKLPQLPLLPLQLKNGQIWALGTGHQNDAEYNRRAKFE